MFIKSIHDSFNEVLNKMHIELGAQLGDKIPKNVSGLFLVDIENLRIGYNELLEEMPYDAREYAFAMVLAYFKMINDFAKENADGIAAGDEDVMKSFAEIIESIENIHTNEKYVEILKEFDYGKDIFYSFLKDANNYYCVEYKFTRR